MRRSPLTVGIDVTPTLAGHTGVARYVRQLLSHLDDAGVTMRPYAIGRGEGDLPSGTRHVRVPLRAVHAAWRTIGWPGGRIVAGRCDVVHATDLVPPPSRVPAILTIHDVAAAEYPELHPPRAVAIQRDQLERVRDVVDVVIADSRSTADGIVRAGVDPARVAVVPLGRSDLGAPSFDRVPPGPYFLAAGAIAARKGLEVLVAAFAGAGLTGVRLVLAGPPGWGAERVAAAVAASPARGAIVMAGRVSDAEMAGLYQRCLAVCVPSWAEGFGFPVLEACAAAAPVIASDLAVLHEVGGGVPVYVPAGDVDRWSEALATLAADAELRTRLALAGPGQAAGFTWEKCAEATAAIYRRAAGQGAS